MRTGHHTSSAGVYTLSSDREQKVCGAAAESIGNFTAGTGIPTDYGVHVLLTTRYAMIDFPMECLSEIEISFRAFLCDSVHVGFRNLRVRVRVTALVQPLHRESK